MRPIWPKLMILVATVLVIGPAACDRGKNAAVSKSAASQKPVEPAGPKPDYAFAAGLDDEYPEVVRFLRHFMETALAGDYAGYRRLVSRVADPESRARFEKVLNSLRSLTIESIEETHLPDVREAYRVVAAAELRPEAQETLRRRNNNRLAILVLEEEGEFRMMLASSDLQPAETQPQPATAPTGTAPNYPWRSEGDY
jgi:hypothetical protein